MSKEVHDDVRKALEIAARKRHKATLARKVAQKSTLNAHGYHCLQKQLNKKTFLAPIDADTTKANIFYIRKKFTRFCREKQHGNWKDAIKWQYCDKGLIMTFLLWICETYIQPKRKPSKRKSINQYWRDFKMLYRRSNEGRVVNANVCEEIRKASEHLSCLEAHLYANCRQYINGHLTVAFKLDDQPGSKPVMGVDDLLLGLTHHWCRDRSIFPTEDDRLDLSTIMLFQSYTACRPAELVDGTKSRGVGDPMLDDSDDEYSSTKTSYGCGRTVKPSIEAQQTHTGGSVVLEKSEMMSDSEPDELESSDGDNTSDTQHGMECNQAEHAGDVSDDIEMGGCRAAVPRTGEDDAEENSEPIRRHKALCYEDIVLWIVQDPKRGDRDVLAMEVFFRYHKGADRKPKPTIFLFRENPLPILCPVSHFLARAIRDDAIEVDGFNHAAPFFSNHIGKRAIKAHWKPSVLKMPVFRRSVQIAAGWVKSNTEPMKYSTYAFYLDRIGRDLGSEEKWTSYCFRRGHANALLGVAPDSIVDQVMRHDPLTGCMQNAYQNHRIGFNTQDAFLERDPSADGLTKAFTHMSIRCNPEVPKEIPKDELDKLPLDPEVVCLKERIRKMALHMRQVYGFIKYSPDVVKEEYQQLRRDLKNTEKIFKADMTKIYQKACRRHIHNDELQKQLGRMVEGPESAAVEPAQEPSVRHQLEERTQLPAIFSDFRQGLDNEYLTDRKIQAVDLMVLLASRREVHPSGQLPSSSPTLDESRVRQSHLKTAPLGVEEIPLLLGKTQCIYCIGEERLPYDTRMRSFKRVSHMMDHVENVHLKSESNAGSFICRHPQCMHLGNFLTSPAAFKTHVQQVHGVKLRSSWPSAES